MIYTRFLLAECSRCGEFVLEGTVAGARFRVNTRTVPRCHASVLKRYGVPVLVAQLDRRGLNADFWDPGTHDLDRPDRHLLTVHVCGARGPP